MVQLFAHYFDDKISKIRDNTCRNLGPRSNEQTAAHPPNMDYFAPKRSAENHPPSTAH